MKGVILAGGTGSRLYPSTKVTNKHLLPVYNKPMIHYPIQTLKNSGIRDILIITGADHTGDFMKLLGSGIDYGVQFTYRVQDGSGGIAQALSLAEDFSANEPLAVILADNIFEDSFETEIANFKDGAHIFAKEVEDARRFGVIGLDSKNHVTSIEEKPDIPVSNLAQTGFYIYDQNVFDYIRSIEPSERGELEITDVNNIYLEKNKLKASTVDGMWVDAGTHTSLLESSILSQEAFNPDRIKQRKTQYPALFSKGYNTNYPLVTVGLVTYNSQSYIRACLHSLMAQDYDNTEIYVLDNNSTDDTLSIIRDEFPSIKIIESKENMGFARSHNEIVRQTNGEFYACLNVDMIFEPNFLSELVKTMSKKSTIAATGGKIKQWDFETYTNNKEGNNKGKTNFIDSAGIKIFRSHRFTDRGQGEVDHGQFDHTEEIFGISGAAVLYRRKALEDVAHTVNDKKEYFDESMFMYKEDVDLAYRLQWAGWKTFFTPHSVSYHDRTVAALGDGFMHAVKNRSNKSKRVNKISYLNHQLMLQKNFSGAFSSHTKGATWWYNFKVFMYILVFETELLSVWWNVFKMRKQVNKKRKAMPRRVSHSTIEQFMEG